MRCNNRSHQGELKKTKRRLTSYIISSMAVGNMESVSQTLLKPRSLDSLALKFQTNL